MKCQKCGKEIADDSVFCEYCGYKNKIIGPKQIWIMSFILLAFFAMICAGFVYYTGYLQIDVPQEAKSPVVYEGDNAELTRLQCIVDSLTVEINNSRDELRNDKIQKELSESFNSEISSLKRQNESLKAEIKSLKNQNTSLEAKVQRYKELLNN